MNNDRLNQQIKLAKEALRQGDRQSASEISRRIIDQHPNCLEAWLILGGLSNPEMRWRYLRQAQKIAPSDPRVREALAWAESQQAAEQNQSQIVQSDSTIGDTGDTQANTTNITEAQVSENHHLVWLWALIFMLALLILFLGLGILPQFNKMTDAHVGIFQSTNINKPTLTQIPDQNTPATHANPTDALTLSPSPSLTPTPSPTPTVVPNLYGCNMEIGFSSGPLADESTTFTMLDETYFYDKGDKFETGKNTGIFYDEERYVILHSGFNNGSILSPLEIEFLRKYLELWGDEEIDFIEGQIEDLIGAEAVWRCDGQDIMKTRVNNVVRLSHEASTRLWLEPTNIYEILESREGEQSEWIGEINQIFPKTIHLGFCGWGPPEVEADRSTYFRYLVQFEILE